MNVDETGRHDHPARVDDELGRAPAQWPHRGDLAGSDRDIAGPRRITRAVNDAAVANQHVKIRATQQTGGDANEEKALHWQIVRQPEGALDLVRTCAHTVEEVISMFAGAVGKVLTVVPLLCVLGARSDAQSVISARSGV